MQMYVLFLNHQSRISIILTFLQIRIYMNLGVDQGFSKDNVSEFLVEEAGLSYADIKNVIVENNHSSFTIPQHYENQLRLNLKGYKVSHRNVKLSEPEFF